MILPKNACANCGADLDVVRMSACCNHPGRIVPFSIADFPADPVPDLQATIARLTAERDEARAASAAAYERAAQYMMDRANGCPDYATSLVYRIHARGIRSLATEAETTALAEMLDTETRECAELMQPMLRSMLSRGEAYRIILARIDQRKEEGV